MSDAADAPPTLDEVDALLDEVGDWVALEWAPDRPLFPREAAAILRRHEAVPASTRPGQSRETVLAAEQQLRLQAESFAAAADATPAGGDPAYQDDWDEDEPETGASGYASLSGVAPTEREPLDLDMMELDEEEPAGADGLLDDASRLAAADQAEAPAPAPARRRSLVPGSGEGGAAGSGATLFERMANLSRGSRTDDDDDDDDTPEGSSISIPRFLGRQNNQ